MQDELDIYPVYCPRCDFFGYSDECLYLKCPYCKERVKRDKNRNEEKEE